MNKKSNLSVLAGWPVTMYEHILSTKTCMAGERKKDGIRRCN